MACLEALEWHIGQMQKERDSVSAEARREFAEAATKPWNPLFGVNPEC
jgi:hypothetical protein